jgi:hypothetical protein
MIFPGMATFDWYAGVFAMLCKDDPFIPKAWGFAPHPGSAAARFFKNAAIM